MWCSTSNPVHTELHFSALCYGDYSVVGTVVVCGCVSSSVFLFQERCWEQRNYTPSLDPRKPSLYSIHYLKIVILDSLCPVFYGRVVWIHTKACIVCRWWCCLCLADDSVDPLHCGKILSGVARFQHFMKFQSIKKRAIMQHGLVNLWFQVYDWWRSCMHSLFLSHSRMLSCVQYTPVHLHFS